VVAEREGVRSAVGAVAASGARAVERCCAVALRGCGEGSRARGRWRWWWWWWWLSGSCAGALRALWRGAREREKRGKAKNEREVALVAPRRIS
jgi:hypothetical protein